MPFFLITTEQFRLNIQAEDIEQAKEIFSCFLGYDFSRCHETEGAWYTIEDGLTGKLLESSKVPERVESDPDA